MATTSNKGIVADHPKKKKKKDENSTVCNGEMRG